MELVVLHIMFINLKRFNNDQFFYLENSISNPTLKIFFSFTSRVLDILNKWLTKFEIINENYLLFGLYPTLNYSLSSLKKIRNTDVFLIYWISKFIDCNFLLKLKSHNPKAKFIFILVDEAILTGGCHYTLNCKNFNIGCIDCPAASSTFIKKLIYKNFNNKFSSFINLDSKFIFPSKIMEIMFIISNLLLNSSFSHSFWFFFYR